MNDKEYEYSTCEFCGKTKSWITHSFMVPDGHDDVDWDLDEWCLNENCPTNYLLNRNMANTIPKSMVIEKQETYKLKTKHYALTFDPENSNIRFEDRNGLIGNLSLSTDGDEKVCELYDIFKEIYKINQGE